MHRMCLHVINLWILSLSFGSLALSKSFSQLVVPFPEQKSFEYAFNESENTLRLSIQNTQPEELSPLYSYDSQLVNRVIFKELSSRDVDIIFHLRGRGTRVAVYSFEEPFRIVIDLFSQNYREMRNPASGHPENSSDYRDSRLTERSRVTRPRLVENDRSLPTRRQFVDSSPQETSYPSNGNSELVAERKLLQPKPKDFTNPEEMIVALDRVGGGIGPKWKLYPPYIYRFQTDTLKTGKNYKSWLKKNAGRAMSSGEALADYAGQLYTFGHELKSLLVYQKVLYDAPLVFEKNAKHIWNLAEIHLGQGNLTLAKGYYESLIDKHPDSPLSGFSKLRILDIAAQRSTESNKWVDFSKHSDNLNLIVTNKSPELAAQVAIRKSYWGQTTERIKDLYDQKYGDIPIPNAETIAYLNSSRDQAEHPKSLFLIRTMQIAAALKNSKWDNALAADVKNYLNEYKGASSEPYRSIIVSRAKNNFNQKVMAFSKENKPIDVIRLVENIPPSLNVIKSSYELTWIVAESYRVIESHYNSIQFYKQSVSLARTEEEKFVSQFRHLNAIHYSLTTALSEKKVGLANRLRRSLNVADSDLLRTWRELKDSTKFRVTRNLKDEIRRIIDSDLLTKSHPEMLLWTWNKSLNNDAEKPDEWKTAFSSSEEDIYRISKLSQKFLDIGNVKKSNETKGLLRQLSPQDFKTKRSKDLWAEELTSLAETYRKNNDYLDAGRIYALTGLKSENWEKRAEALYKGGLLLYRSGRREEALKAFEGAANDGNNLLYAELARKRLEQLNE